MTTLYIEVTNRVDFSTSPATGYFNLTSEQDGLGFINFNSSGFVTWNVGTLDDGSFIYPDVETANEYLIASQASAFISAANVRNGDIYDNFIFRLYDANAAMFDDTKQDQSAVLDNLSSMSLSSNQMLYANGASTFGTFSTTSYGRGLLATSNSAALCDALSDGSTNKAYTAAEKTKLSGLSAQVQSDWTASSGLGVILNKPTIPSVARTTSSDTQSLVGTGATGAQISTTKDSTVRYNVSTSTTTTIGNTSTSLVALKICSTNNSTEASWTTVATLENDQTITLAIALQSVQTVKGQLTADVPAGWYVKLVNTGTGTHSESFISGQKTIYG